MTDLPASPLPPMILPPASGFADFAARLVRNRSVTLGLCIVACVVVVALSAPWIAPYGYSRTNMIYVWEPPGPQFRLGTDALGRDVLSRIVIGARVSLTVALSVLAIVLPFGTFVGMVAAWFGGWVDAIAMRGADITFAFPELIIAILIAAML